MTDTSTEQTAETVSVDLSEYEDATIATLWGKVKAAEPAAWDLHERIKKTSPPSTTEIDKIVEESDDEELTKMRTQISKLETQLQNAREKARKHVLDGYETASDEDVEGMREDLKTQVNVMRNLVNLVTQVAETLGYEDVTKAVKAYKLPTLRGVSSGAAAGQGTGTPRIRVSAIRVSLNGTELRNFVDDKAKLSYAGTYLKTNTDALREAWFAAYAEANDLKPEDVKASDIHETVTFDFESEDKEYTVSITPYEK